MFWTPGISAVEPLPAMNADELRLEPQLREDVATLAGRIGERNVDPHPEKLEEAAQWIENSFRAAGCETKSQWYRVGKVSCRNVECEIRGATRRGEVVIVGAHYDSVPESPGADDDASGVAVVLALARAFVGAKPARTLRFVGFANEEPPYFWQVSMGSRVYAKRCRQQRDRVTAMLSIESVGFYSTTAKSQKYPAGLGLLYPATGNFVAFVGDVFSRPLVHETMRTFRGVPALPSLGAAAPNAVPGVGWSDHWSFWQEGFPGIEITDTAPYRNPYYHTAMDTPERLDYDRLARLTWGLRRVVGELVE
jgi:Iap family predicted aminopeptidase